jgi:outer membrane protein insertion porin family
VPITTFFPTRPGGDFQTVTNLEYRIPIAGPVSMSLFTDLGINGILRKSDLSLSSSAVGLLQEQYPNRDFPNLKIRGELPVIAGNFSPHSSSGIEFVVQLPIVNAPFRFYYAYNFLRLNETITGPRGGYALPDPLRQSLADINVLTTQVAPALNTILDQQVQRIPAGLVEPSHTFRFTVSRTF